MKHIQAVLPPIVSIAIFVVIAILMSTVPSLNFDIDAYFWAELVGSTIALLLTYVVWCPTGEDKAKKERKVINNARVYNHRANYIIQHQMFTELAEFCKYKNEELRLEIIRDKLASQVINYNVYELFIKKDRTEEEDTRLFTLMANMTDKQRDLLQTLATRGVKCEKLTPQNLTMGRAKRNRIVNKNHEKLYKHSRIIMKSVWGIFTTCFTYFVVITPNDSFGLAQIVMITMWFFTFLTAIYSAIKTGYNSIAVYRDTYNQEQAELCAEFFAFAGKSVQEIDSTLPPINESK